MQYYSETARGQTRGREDDRIEGSSLYCLLQYGTVLVSASVSVSLEAWLLKALSLVALRIKHTNPATAAIGYWKKNKKKKAQS